MADLLARAGCQMVRIGVQTVNDGTLADHDRLGDAAAVAATARALDRRGVAHSIDHILGLPGDSVADQRAALSLYCELRPARVQLHWMTYFPGTVAFDQAVASGLLAPHQVRALLRGDAIASYGVPEYLAARGRPAELAELRRLEFLFHALAALPASWVRWMLESGAYRAAPRGLMGRHVAYAIALVAGRPAARERLRSVAAATSSAAAVALGRALRRWLRVAVRKQPDGFAAVATT
jgi:hypothetical protein